MLAQIPSIVAVVGQGQECSTDLKLLCNTHLIHFLPV